jgi:hypothetical protein
MKQLAQRSSVANDQPSLRFVPPEFVSRHTRSQKQGVSEDNAELERRIVPTLARRVPG